ncbi:MAG: Sec-independent protein translocase subunit TatB [Pseudomonadota bacterium]|jgi:sec-independent protein translocase protein TatB
MLDIGFSKLLIVGGIALVVIGPERLPRLARMAGTMLGRAQRYVADVKAEVNRSIEVEEMQRMKREFETSARDLDNSIQREINAATTDIDRGLAGDGVTSEPSQPVAASLDAWEGSSWTPAPEPPPGYVRPDKHWRVKRGALPRWYRQRAQVKSHVQSGAARVARFRPRPGGSAGR